MTTVWDARPQHEAADDLRDLRRAYSLPGFVPSITVLKCPAGIGSGHRAAGGMPHIQQKRRSQRRISAGGRDVSVIMPTTSWTGPFEPCARRIIDLIEAARFTVEFIVVHDGPMPKPPAWLRRWPVTVLQTRARGGPAAARNKGADQARGRILFFVDADVEVAPDALDRVHATLSADDGPVAVFGAYDDDPAAAGVVSRFRNLLHHHVHVSHPGDAGTFWAGCGAVRAVQFEDVGGFDETYSSPSVEDIELGIRIAGHGGRILLDPLLQGKHHKAWTLRSMVTTDICSRAIPWSRLIAESGRLPSKLNMDWKSRISGIMAVAAVAAALSAACFGGAAYVAIACVTVVVALNGDFYLLCGRRGGPAFAAAAVVLHLLFFLYSSITFGAVLLHTSVFGNRRGSCTSSSDPTVVESFDPEEESLPVDAAVSSTS